MVVPVPIASKGLQTLHDRAATIAKKFTEPSFRYGLSINVKPLRDPFSLGTKNADQIIALEGPVDQIIVRQTKELTSPEATAILAQCTTATLQDTDLQNSWLWRIAANAQAVLSLRIPASIKLAAPLTILLPKTHHYTII